MSAQAVAGAHQPELRLRAIRAASGFSRAWGAYVDAVERQGRGPAPGEAAEAARQAAEVYRAALNDLLAQLVSSQSGAEGTAEARRVSRLIELLGDEAGAIQG
jgi:hypothetical protein